MHIMMCLPIQSSMNSYRLSVNIQVGVGQLATITTNYDVHNKLSDVTVN